jgi:hypothetical protein
LILQEYAVEPAAIAGWDKFRYITEKFGFDHGRLISRYPEDWEERVLHACSGLRDVGKKKELNLSNEEYHRILREKAKDFSTPVFMKWWVSVRRDKPA